MAKNTKQTSPRVASVASKVLRDGRYSAAAKTSAGSALAQATSKKHKKLTIEYSLPAEQKILCTFAQLYICGRLL